MSAHARACTTLCVTKDTPYHGHASSGAPFGLASRHSCSPPDAGTVVTTWAATMNSVCATMMTMMCSKHPFDPSRTIDRYLFERE